MSAGLKRGFITARIGQSEGHHLPAANVELTSQTEEKQKILRELCLKYETSKEELTNETKESDELNKRLSSLQNVISLLEKESENQKEYVKLRELEDKKRKKEIIQLRLEKKKEKMLYEELNKKLNNLNVRLQSLSSTDHETHTKQAIIKMKIQSLEEERKHLVSALTKDDHIIRDLREYLSQTAKSVFEQQQKLDHMQIGIKSSQDDLRTLQKKMRMEKRNQMNLKSKIEQCYQKIQEKEEQVEQMQTEKNNHYTHERELEGRRAQIQSLEEIWLGLDDKLITSEISLADFRTKKERIEGKIKKLQAKISLLSMQPTPSLYKGYVSNGLDISFKRKKKSSAPYDDDEKRISTRGSMRESIENARRETLEKESEYLKSDNDFSAFIDCEQYDYMKKEIKDRDQFLKSAESEAEELLRRQNVKEERTAQELHSEVDGLERNISSLQKVIEDKKIEYDTNEDRIHRINEKILSLQILKEESERKAVELRTNKEIQTESLLLSLNDERNALEHERNELLSQNRLFERDIAETKHQLALIVSWKNSLNYKEFKDLKNMKELWSNKVIQLQSELKILEETLASAKKSNSLVRGELKIVKPYEPETYEYEMLKFEESQLDHQLADLKRKQTSDALTAKGCFEFPK
ncbi:unnamed protein product [Auanema sp. JU1783]|nr:unnamed protein product [Auanema sp. JU1783]